MNTAQIASAVSGVLASCGLELDCVEVIPAGRRSVVRVVVDGDGPQGRGPDMEAIVAASRAVSSALDEGGIAGANPYTLEVTSRGLSRPLTKPQHWRRNRDRLVKISLEAETVTGRIFNCDEQSVTIGVLDSQRVINFTDIKKAIIEIEMNRSNDDNASDVESETESEKE